MGRPIHLLILIFYLLVYSCTHVQSEAEEGFISVDISNKGLDFVKDELINMALSSLVPLELPEIEKAVKIPVVGKVDVVLSNITLYRVDVTSSTVKTGDTGIVISVSGATANLSMNWKYSYSTWLIPIAISDKGEASIQVEGMDMGLTLSLTNQEGSLKVSLLDSGCYVNEISIKLDGGASWLYQGLIDAFDDKISTAVEDAVSKKIKEGAGKLDSVLQSLPKEVPITKVAALNVTIVDDPVLSNSSIDLEVNGLFAANDAASASNNYNKRLHASYSCKDPDKMVSISLHEEVLETAALVYFDADKMHWIVDKVPDQSLLNTAGWRFVVPQLYKQYPNDDMTLNISVSSPPIVKVQSQQIDATIPSEVVINVVDAGEVIPVACISVTVSASASPGISGNALAGSVKLNDFSLSLKWSKIGSFHMRLVQSVISTLLKTVVVPYVNLQLRRGYQLPSFHGYELQNAEISCTDLWIVVCSDVKSNGHYNLNLGLNYHNILLHQS